MAGQNTTGPCSEVKICRFVSRIEVKKAFAAEFFKRITIKFTRRAVCINNVPGFGLSNEHDRPVFAKKSLKPLFVIAVFFQLRNRKGYRPRSIAAVAERKLKKPLIGMYHRTFLALDRKILKVLIYLFAKLRRLSRERMLGIFIKIMDKR